MMRGYGYGEPFPSQRSGTPYAWPVAGHLRIATEGRVVTRVIEELLERRVRPADILLEFRIDHCCRVDIAVLTVDPLLLVECKGFPYGKYEHRQVIRYRDAARVRWPDRDVMVVLAAPGRRTKATDPEGIVSVVV